MYRRNVIFLGLTLLFAGFLIPYSPAFVLLAAAALWMWGEDLLIWAYTRWRPVEPVRSRWATGRG